MPNHDGTGPRWAGRKRFGRCGNPRMQGRPPTLPEAPFPERLEARLARIETMIERLSPGSDQSPSSPEEKKNISKEHP